MGEKVVMLFLFSPIVVLLILSYLKPEEMLLWGKSFIYDEEPEFSEGYIKYTKYASLVALMFIFSLVIRSLSKSLGLLSFLITIIALIYLVVFKK